MPRRDWKFRIQDILDAIGAIKKYTQGMEFKNFTIEFPCTPPRRNLTVTMSDISKVFRLADILRTCQDTSG